MKWATSKLIEDIRAQPDISGKALNQLLFNRYGLYMKQSTMYSIKCCDKGAIWGNMMSLMDIYLATQGL